MDETRGVRVLRPEPPRAAPALQRWTGEGWGWQGGRRQRDCPGGARVAQTGLPRQSQGELGRKTGLEKQKRNGLRNCQ